MDMEHNQIPSISSLLFRLKRNFKNLFPNSIHLSFWIIAGYCFIILLHTIHTSKLLHQIYTLQNTLLSDPPTFDFVSIRQVIGPILAQFQLQLILFGFLIIAVCLICMALSLSLLQARIIRPLKQLRLAPQDQPHQTSFQEDRIAKELRPFVKNYFKALQANRERQAELQDQLQHTALLTRLSIELRETFEPEVIIQQILSTIVLNLNGVTASIITIDSNSEVAYAASMRGQHLRVIPPESANKLLEEGLAGWVLRHGYHVILSDVSQDERWLQLHANAKTGSAMSLLLTQARITLGVLTITHPEPEHFTSRDLIMLEGVASQAAVALNSARRHIESERRRQQALHLFAMSQSLTVTRSGEELAEELLREGLETFEASYAAIFLNEHHEQKPQLFAGYAGKQLLLAAQQEPWPEALADLHTIFHKVALQAWQSLQATSGNLSPEHAAQLQLLTGQVCPMPGYVVMPLLHNGTCFGVFLLVRATNGTLTFSADMWSLLTTFTNVAASAFANVQLMQQLQKRAEELEELVDNRTIQLQESRNLLRVVFDNLPDGLVLLDHNAHILTINTTLSNTILGLSPKQIVSHHYPTVLKHLQTKQQVVIESPIADTGTQRIRCRTSNNDERWYEVNRYPIQTGERFQAIERWRDITRQEELHRQLLLHEQLTSMGRLALSVVHEVGNPLQSVLACLDLCQEDSSMQASSKEYLGLAYQELDRMQHILQRLRNLYRPPQLTWSMCQLNELVNKVRRITERQLQRYKIQVITDLDPNLPMIYAQEDALQQVFLNLILNAQEAMPDGGQLMLMSRFDAEQQICHFQIRDTGVGIDPKRIPHLFEPFQSNKTQGLGLGLYLCKQIIDQHAGQIVVESAVDVGTTVSLRLPQARERNEESYYPNS